MPEINSYRLIAYDSVSGKEIFNWPNDAATHIPNPGNPARGLEGEVLIDQEMKW